MTESPFPTAPRTADAIRGALRENNIERANRLITELFGRVINPAAKIPSGALDEPRTTGDERYDTVLAIGLGYALTLRGLPPEPWMNAAAPLMQEWLWDGDAEASPEYRSFIRGQTPPVFLEKGILLRDRDLRIL